MSSKILTQVLRITRNSPLFTASCILLIGISTLYFLQSRRLRRTSVITPSRERVLILGATSGVGRTLAHKYASRGAFLCVVGSIQQKLDDVVRECNEVSQREGFEDRILGFKGNRGDVRDMSQLRETLQKHEAWRGLDTLILPAGGSAVQQLASSADNLSDDPFLQASPEAIQHAVDAAMVIVNGNFIGPYIAAVTFIPLLFYASRSPSVLLLSTVPAVLPPPTRLLNVATKVAATLLYRLLSIEYSSISFTFFLPQGALRTLEIGIPVDIYSLPTHECDPDEHDSKYGFVADRCIRAIDTGKNAVFSPSYLSTSSILHWV